MPAQVDVMLTDCSDDMLNGDTVLEIVRLESKKISLCFGEPGYDCPGAFDSLEGTLIVGGKR